ncbi:hypothetical protein AB0O14_17775 [Microbacterium foliorum]|uniref:hypothetical protein n=1 Tax=Rothia terrae TaxID=396015 RepID=UPI00342FC6B9
MNEPTSEHRYNYGELIKKANLDPPQSVIQSTGLPAAVYTGRLALVFYSVALTENGHIPKNFRDHLAQPLQDYFTEELLDQMQALEELKREGSGYKLASWPDIAAQINARDTATRPSKSTVMYLLNHKGKNAALVENLDGIGLDGEPVTVTLEREPAPIFMSLQSLGWSQEEYDDPAIWY